MRRRYYKKRNYKRRRKKRHDSIYREFDTAGGEDNWLRYYQSKPTFSDSFLSIILLPVRIILGVWYLLKDFIQKKFCNHRAAYDTDLCHWYCKKCQKILPYRTVYRRTKKRR